MDFVIPDKTPYLFIRCTDNFTSASEVRFTRRKIAITWGERSAFPFPTKALSAIDFFNVVDTTVRENVILANGSARPMEIDTGNYKIDSFSMHMLDIDPTDLRRMIMSRRSQASFTEMILHHGETGRIPVVTIGFYAKHKAERLYASFIYNYPLYIKMWGLDPDNPSVPRIIL